MVYNVKIFSMNDNLTKVDKIELNYALWNTTYCPKTIAQMWIVENETVYLRMECFEKNPKRDYKQHNDPIYKDSCMECFINFNPEKSCLYLNMEINANGAMLMQVGSKRRERIPMLNKLEPKPFETNDSWGFVLEIPISFIKDLYGDLGLEWKANFYKCGDDCEQRHFLAWQNIESVKPDFHTPQFFGDLKVMM